MLRDSKKSQQKWQKNMANFGENGKNRGKIMASSHGPEDHYRVYENSASNIDDHRYMHRKVFSRKFCRCRALKYIFLWWRHAHILS